jgi:hypothetical protein
VPNIYTRIVEQIKFQFYQHFLNYRVSEKKINLFRELSALSSDSIDEFAIVFKLNGIFLLPSVGGAGGKKSRMNEEEHVTD